LQIESAVYDLQGWRGAASSPFCLLPEEEYEGSKAGNDMEGDEVQIGAPTLIILGGFRRSHRLSSGMVVPRLALTTEQGSTWRYGAH